MSNRGGSKWYRRHRYPRVGKGRTPLDLPIEILYEDTSLIAVCKPSGLLVVPDRFDPTKPTLFDAVWHHFHKNSKQVDVRKSLPRLVHRLDKDTSGVICFAKTYEAQRFLQKSFEENLVQKRYLALIVGTIEASFSIEQPLAPLRKKRGLMVVDPSGKPSKTNGRLLEAFSKHSLVEVFPKTGRQHQIRVHLAFIGHPLAYDPPYRRAPAEIPISSVCPRLTLHASSLSFLHPEEKTQKTIEASLPDDLQQAIQAARVL